MSRANTSRAKSDATRLDVGAHRSQLGRQCHVSSPTLFLGREMFEAARPWAVQAQRKEKFGQRTVRSAEKEMQAPPTRNRNVTAGSLCRGRRRWVQARRERPARGMTVRDAEQCRSVCEIDVWPGCFHPGHSEPAKTIERRPCARGFSRRRQPGQALQRGEGARRR
jgi:hypothetical protein